MGDVSAAGVALIIIFIFVLLVISIELAYVLWYRRRFKRAPPFSGSDSEMAAAESYGTPDSKELLLYHVLSHGHGHQLRSERAPPMADNLYSFPPAIGYAWPGSNSPSPWPSPPPAWYGAENSPSPVKKGSSPPATEEKGSPAPEKKGYLLEEKTMREEEEEREFEFAEVGMTDQPTPFYTPWSSPSREMENSLGLAYYPGSDVEESTERKVKLLRRVEIPL